MLLKTYKGQTVNFFFLNKKMLDAFKDSSLSVSELPKLITYHQKLTPSEIGNILRLQAVVCSKLTGKELDLTTVYDSVDNKLVQTLIVNSFNGADSKGLLKQVESCNSFYVKGLGGNNHAILLDVDEEKIPVDWVRLTSNKFSTALLEAIYVRVGYLESHFNDVSKNVTGDFSLSDVYKLINIEP